MAAGPPPEWTVGQRVKYVEWARRVIANVRGVSPWLEQQFDEAASAVDRTIDATRARPNS